MTTALRRPTATDAASQCRELGLAVGDTIVGRQRWPEDRWAEAKLTLLFLGREVAVWRVQRRDSLRPRWKTAGEQANWTLNCREWRRAKGGEPRVTGRELRRP
jgi:hypothetical protein